MAEVAKKTRELETPKNRHDRTLIEFEFFLTASALKRSDFPSQFNPSTYQRLANRADSSFSRSFHILSDPKQAFPKQLVS